MKLVTKFLTTTASIYYFKNKYLVISNGKIIFNSYSKEMCVGIALNKQQIKLFEDKLTRFLTQITKVDTVIPETN